MNRTASEGFREYTQRVDIHILNDLPPDDPLHIHGVTSKNGLLYIHGTQKTLGTGQLSAASPTDVQARQQATITDASRTAWEAGSLVYIASRNAYATIIKDLGGGQARITDPTVVKDILGDGPDCYPDITALAAGDEYQIISQVQVTHSGLIDLAGSGARSDSLFGFNLILENITILRPKNTHRWSNLFLNGQFNAFYRVLFEGPTLFISGNAGIYQCCIKDSGEALATGTIMHLGGSAFINTSLSLYGHFHRLNGCVFQNSNVVKFNHGNQIWARRSGFFDVTAKKAVIWLNGGTLEISGEGIYGDGNTVPGVILEGNATLKYAQGMALQLGGLPELRIGGKSPKFDSATPPLEKFAGGTIPLQSPCSSWAELAAEPFNGEAANYTKGAYVIKNE